MSEETVSPRPDEPVKAEGQGHAAEASEAAASEFNPDIPVGVQGEMQAAAASPEVEGEAVAFAKIEGEAQSAADSSRIVGEAQAAAKVLGDISMRRSPWKSSLAAIRYVHGAAKTDHVQIRTSDRMTIIALLFFCIAEVLSLVYSPLHGFRFAFMSCCDFILGTCIVLFLIYRVGILSALNTRQALICWQLMMGCIFLGIFLCLNAIFGIAYLVETFFPHSML
jgi:hypothetical protein